MLHKTVSARGTVSAEEEFFQDHFPDFPVLPGVLMLEILRRSALQEAPPDSWRISEIRNVKYSNFLKPGEQWEAQLQVSEENRKMDCRGKLLKEGQPVCSAQFTLRHEGKD